MKYCSLIQFLSLSSFAIVDCFQPEHSAASGPPRLQRLQQSVAPTEGAVSTRRNALLSIFAGGSVALVRSSSASALDMESFINSELASDTKNCNPKSDSKCIPKLTEDEAMCKYGQSGEARGEACKRFKQAGGALAKPGSSSQIKGPGGAYAM